MDAPCNRETYEDGHRDGYRDGHRDGYNEGYDQACEHGTSTWEEGCEYGLREGFDFTLTKLIRYIEGKRQPTADEIIVLRWLLSVQTNANHLARS